LALGLLKYRLLYLCFAPAVDCATLRALNIALPLELQCASPRRKPAPLIPRGGENLKNDPDWSIVVDAMAFTRRPNMEYGVAPNMSEYDLYFTLFCLKIFLFLTNFWS
jgi:hypothetical protein